MYYYLSDGQIKYYYITISSIARRLPRFIVRSIVDGYHYSYDFLRWILPSIFSNRCWLRDHSYDQSYDQPKINRSIRPLLEIVANIADRSHLGQIATNRTIKKSYDPVWLWLNKASHYTSTRYIRFGNNYTLDCSDRSHSVAGECTFVHASDTECGMLYMSPAPLNTHLPYRCVVSCAMLTTSPWHIFYLPLTRARPG